MSYGSSAELGNGEQLELKHFTKKRWLDYSWIILPLFIFWLLGLYMGIYASKMFFQEKLSSAVKMNRIMIQDKATGNNIVYDLMVFDSISKDK